MQIKRFEAKNMTEALRQIKRTLGPEAVILSAKDRRKENRLLGLSRKIGVEVTAAVDEDYPGIGDDRKGMERSAGGQGIRQQPKTRPIANAGDRRKKYPMEDIVRLNGGKSSRLASESYRNHGRVCDEVYFRDSDSADQPASFSGETSPSPGNDDMTRYLAKNGLSAGALQLEKKTGNIIALVGNAGVGKTTTIAKLAARFQLIQEKPVGLMTLDRHRIGGVEQLQCYADSMQLPFEAPGDAHDLQEAMGRLKKYPIVLVDTPAINPGEATRVAQLNRRLKKMGTVKTLLVLSAEAREEDLRETLRRYADMKPCGAIITKTDLTGSYTELVNFLCHQALPVHFYANGHRVPFDLTEATLERLADHFLQKGASRPGDSTAGGVAESIDRSEAAAQNIYLANKNSDIFHRPECKWIRLINRSNIVEFDSFAEALNNRFKPCRYCNPQHLSITGMLYQERAAY